MILELSLWKLKMKKTISQEKATNCQKKVKTDESSMRRQCHITCGAEVVIQHVLPYVDYFVFCKLQVICVHLVLA